MGLPSQYAILDVDRINSPSAILFREIVASNIDEMIRVAGSADRLRPHCKTHKSADIARLLTARGITRHKCATIAEAEMLSDSGAKDVLLAYNVVGPNLERVVRLRQRFPDVRLCVTADHPLPVARLEEAMRRASLDVEVMLDVDTGMRRTGIAPGEAAERLYGEIVAASSLIPGGLHLYDGHNHQTDLEARRPAVLDVWRSGNRLRDRLVERGWSVPRIVVGGTGSFPVFAEIDDPRIELSPGTVVLFDRGYQETFPDLAFTPALLILTRVISRPSPTRLTLDAGTKSVASDPPMGTRLYFPDLPDARQVVHNEEHLVLETPEAEGYRPGDALLGIPRHVCPTTALHESLRVVSGGRWTDSWPVTARDRALSI